MEESLEKRVDDHEERIRELEIQDGKTGVLMENCIKTMDRLNTTISEVSLTMIKLTEKVENTEKSSNEAKQKIEVIGRKMDSLEEKGKIDFAQWTKDNFFKLIGLIILLALSFPQFSEILQKVF